MTYIGIPMLFQYLELLFLEGLIMMVPWISQLVARQPYIMRYGDLELY
jgi:hypothetical protein